MTDGLAVDAAAWASPWRRRAVGEKALLSGGLVVAGLLLPPWPGSVLVAATAVAVLVGPAAVPVRLLLRSLLPPLSFITVGALSVLVSLDWQAGPRLAVTAATGESALSLVGHGVAGTLAVFVVAATTPMADLLAAMRRWGVPEACTEIAGLVYRLVGVLLGSVRQVREAQASRLGYRDRRTALRSAAALSSTLLVRSWERARRLEEGLAGRGYTGSLPTLDIAPPVSRGFVGATVVGLGLLVAVSVWVPQAVAVAGVR